MTQQAIDGHDQGRTGQARGENAMISRTPFLAMLVLCLLASGGAASGAEAPLGVQEFTSVDELAAAIESRFPKVQGEVKSVQGDRLTLGLGKNDGLMTGMMLKLWRDDREIRHPVTGAVIGRTEQDIGTIEVTAVRDDSSTAVVRKKEKEPRPGDKARITPKKIVLALVPLRIDRQELVEALAARLNELGRFSVVTADTVNAFLKDKTQRDTALVKEMGPSLGADAVVALESYPAEGKSVVIVRIFYTDGPRLLDTVTAVMNLKTKRDSLGEIKPFFAPVAAKPVKEKMEGAPALPVKAQFVAAADFDGKEGREYAFSDGTRVHVMINEPSGWKEIWTDPSSETKSTRHLSLDAADIDGDGKAELYVTAQEGGRVNSFVLVFQEGYFRRVAQAPGFLRVVNYPGRGPVLIGQDFSPAAFFGGAPRQYQWSGGVLVAGPEFPLPKGVGFYGFVLVDAGEARPLVVVRDEKNQLVVYSQDTPIWRSEERYPGGDVVAVESSRDIYNLQRGATIKGRLLTVDIDGDGREEVVLQRNRDRSLISGYKAAELVGLGWTGARLEKKWTVPGIPGPVLDMQILQQGKGNVQIGSLVKEPGGLFAKEQTRLIVYSLQ